MTGTGPGRTAAPQLLAEQHVAAFNAAVTSGDFAAFLTRLADDAVLRFENVPGAGRLEFSGRAAYTAAYAAQPPDDQLDITGPVRLEGGQIVVPFAWRCDGDGGTMRLSVTEAGLISSMTVSFDDSRPAAHG
jgi:steroid delta-isomerase